MSCCKNKEFELTGKENNGENNIIVKILYFLGGVIGFTLIIPLLWVGFVYIIFNSAILNKSSDIFPSMSFIAALLTRKNKSEPDQEDEDEEFDDEFDENDYELLNYEEVNPKE